MSSHHRIRHSRVPDCLRAVVLGNQEKAAVRKPVVLLLRKLLRRLRRVLVIQDGYGYLIALTFQADKPVFNTFLLSCSASRNGSSCVTPSGGRRRAFQPNWDPCWTEAEPKNLLDPPYRPGFSWINRHPHHHHPPRVHLFCIYEAILLTVLM